jgi:PKD repeat protein
MATDSLVEKKRRAVVLAVVVILALSATTAMANPPELRLFQSSPPTVSPVADFYWYPSDPSTYDSVQFCDNSYDPAYMGFSDFSWDFGDGTTMTGFCAWHKFAADGTYTVGHKVQTTDGRTDDVSKQVIVSTHDVAITKFTVPTSASAGQTRQIVVGVRNYIQTEEVQVELYKSDPHAYQGYAWVGTVRQQVPVHSGNRTTDFPFGYTFTSDDAKIGKVTFKAVATIQNARDALPADNAAISLPVKVSGKK